MVEVVFDTEFAKIGFWVKGDDVLDARYAPKPCPEPENGLRIDWCQLGSIIADCSKGSVFEIGIDHSCKTGWQYDQEGGESFLCTTFQHQNGHQAAIGLRDYDWNEVQLDLRVLKATKRPGLPWAKYQANSSAEREFEISLALTKSPVDEIRAQSPWLYVDKVLKF